MCSSGVDATCQVINNTNASVSSIVFLDDDLDDARLCQRAYMCHGSHSWKGHIDIMWNHLYALFVIFAVVDHVSYGHCFSIYYMEMQGS